jgi:Holliday junction resolvase RusA-like endonuclease
MKFVIHTESTGKYSLNKIYSGRHWKQRKDDTEYWHLLTLSALREAKIKRHIFDRPVEIRLCFNDKLDCDNHGYITKMVVDALKGYLIQDDNRKYVSGIYQGFHDRKGIIVEITEATDERV